MKTLVIFALLLVVALAWGKTSKSGHVKMAMLKYAAEKKHNHALKSRGGHGGGRPNGGRGPNGGGPGGNRGGHNGGGRHGGHRGRGGNGRTPVPREIIWRRLINRTCGVDIHDMNIASRPVEPSELTVAVNGFSSQVNATAVALEVHRPNATELAMILQGGDMNALRSHMGLFDDFHSTLKVSMESALCSFVEVYKLASRMEMEGGSGFARDKTCGRSVEILGGLLSNNNWDLDAAAAIVTCNRTLMANLSMAITGDMGCIISDIRDLSDYTAFLSTANLSGVTLRQAQVAMGSVQNWGTMLMHEVVDFAHSAEHLVEVIHVAIDEAPTCPTPSTPRAAKDVNIENFSKAIRQLQQLVSATNVK